MPKKRPRDPDEFTLDDPIPEKPKKQPGLPRARKPPAPVLEPVLEPEEDQPSSIRRVRTGTSVEIDGVTIQRVTIPLWEAKWDRAALVDKMHAIGAREFDRGFRQMAISDEDLLFDSDWIDAALDRTLGLPEYASGMWAKYQRYAGVDLAIAQEDREGAFFCHLSIAIAPNQHRYIMGIQHRRGLSMHQQAELICSEHERWGYRSVVVESNAYQEALVGMLRTQTAVPVVGLNTGALQKKDIEVGVPSLSAEFEQGLWHIPYGDQRTRRLLEPLLDELHAYPTPGHYTDCVMALYFAREAHRVLRVPEPDVRVFLL